MTSRAAANPAPVVALEDAAGAIAKARRATVAERFAANAFTVEWRALTALEPIAGAWRELAAHALEPNVFYEPAFLLAAAPVFGRDAGAVLVWSDGSRATCSACFQRGSNSIVMASSSPYWSA